MGKKLFDQYTYLHFAMGVVMYYWGITFEQWILIHVTFELFENTEFGMHVINKYFGGIWPGGKFQADSGLNMVGDTIGAAFGWLSAMYLDSLGEKMGWYPKHIKDDFKEKKGINEALSLVDYIL